MTNRQPGLPRREHATPTALRSPTRPATTTHKLIRSAGSAGAYSGRRIRATFSRNHAGEPDQPTRSAITVAGILG
ncbi:hypothetical protein J2W14_004103 [Pseudarthrobacter oxydans]|nr:hypothetical protein [Pseudarthrobacter oxydans]